LAILLFMAAPLAAQTTAPAPRSVRPAEVKFNVLGAVNQPGQFRSDGEETLLGAIALAGGWSNQADLSRVIVRRRPSDGGLRPRIVRITLQDVWTGEVEDFLLEPGDTIIIAERPRAQTEGGGSGGGTIRAGGRSRD